MEPCWPLPPAYDRLLGELAELIARAGAWRFVAAPVACADARDYPDAWDETRDGVGRVLARTLWHAHVELELALDDARVAEPATHRRLRDTRLAFSELEGSRAWFTINSIGNDDVAGLAAHEVGRAFVAQLAQGGHPFRSQPADRAPDASLGSLAAVYLGLGVLAANASLYARSGGEVRGSYATHEHQQVRVGGLDQPALTFLLAVQATVRDDVPPAYATLHATQAADFAAWRDALDPHEDELRARLGTGGELAPIARPGAPQTAQVADAFAEDDLRRFNRGHRVYRVPHHQGAKVAFLGIAIGAASVFARIGLGVPLGAMGAGAIAGWLVGRRRVAYRCCDPRCGVPLTADATTCPFCGGTVAGEIAHASDRLARDAELDGEPPG